MTNGFFAVFTALAGPSGAFQLPDILSKLSPKLDVDVGLMMG
jgi:hypothetical protein